MRYFSGSYSVIVTLLGLMLRPLKNKIPAQMGKADESGTGRGITLEGGLAGGRSGHIGITQHVHQSPIGHLPQRPNDSSSAGRLDVTKPMRANAETKVIVQQGKRCFVPSIALPLISIRTGDASSARDETSCLQCLMPPDHFLHRRSLCRRRTARMSSWNKAKTRPPTERQIHERRRLCV